MSKNDIWYGYLKAGEKSSPVVRDMSLETNSKSTVYLYNHKKGAILEYAREIVEPKLCELNSEDTPLDEIRSAFNAARKAFLSGRIVRKWEKDTPADSTPVSSKSDTEDDKISIDLDDEFDADDLDA